MPRRKLLLLLPLRRRLPLRPLLPLLLPLLPHHLGLRHGSTIICLQGRRHCGSAIVGRLDTATALLLKLPLQLRNKILLLKQQLRLAVRRRRRRSRAPPALLLLVALIIGTPLLLLLLHLCEHSLRRLLLLVLGHAPSCVGHSAAAGNRCHSVLLRRL